MMSNCQPARWVVDRALLQFLKPAEEYAESVIRQTAQLYCGYIMSAKTQIATAANEVTSTNKLDPGIINLCILTYISIQYGIWTMLLTMLHATYHELAT